MTVNQVAEKLCMSVRTVWRMVEIGKFPQPIRYNRKLVRWKVEDIEKYIKELSNDGPTN